MLSIGKLGRGQERYYLDKVADGAEDYYRGEGEAAGEWSGEGAAGLGLQGEAGADQLTAMLTGRSPLDGEALLSMQGVRGEGPVPGFDLTFSAPKSVSLLWALGGGDVAAEVQAAHREAIGAALGYLQREACWTRRGAGGRQFVKGSGYLAAAYPHRASRNGDPQLHTHVLATNATQGPDGRWTRLYHPAIYEHATTASYIYEAHLRNELSRRLGVRWQEVCKGIAEIEGFTDEQLRAFSTRRAEILAAAGPDASARSLQVATLATRRTKEADIGREALVERWRSRAQEVGLDREAIEHVIDAKQRTSSRAAEPRTVPDWQVDRAVSARASHFDRRDAIRAVAGCLREGAPGAEVERIADAYLASQSVIRIAEGPKPRYATRRIWQVERDALAAAERMQERGAPAAGELIAARVIGARPSLKADPREMVRRLLAEPEALAVVVGEAGTGKTYAIVAAAEGWAQAGSELQAAAPTWRAANVLRDEGLPATSTAALLAALDRTEQRGERVLARGSVLLVDEAGMVDSASLARLIAYAERSQAKLVLLGDPEQLGEIEAGGLFRAITDRCEPIRLEEVIRHEHQLDREAAKRIREGEGKEAISLYRSAERVTVAPDAEARREAMVADWHEAFARGEDTVMIAKRNTEVERLNGMAREVRKKAGALGAEEIEVRNARFAAGDQVITRVNDRTAQIYNRERWRVAEVDAERRRVVLEGIDRERRVEVDAEYLDRTNPHSEAPALQHAYAVTTYSAQGTTVDRAFVAADPSMDKQELYVAASRSRGQTYLYATPEVQADREEIAPRSPYLRDAVPHIAEAAQRDRAQLAAHDVARLEALPSEELAERCEGLRAHARREQTGERKRAILREQIEERRELLGRVEAQRERAKQLPRKPRRSELAQIDQAEARVKASLTRLEAELRQMPAVAHTARAQTAVIEHALDRRLRLRVLAARLSPPAYIAKELGERPTDPARRKAWDRGAAEIERYRQRHGVNDPERALGWQRTAEQRADQRRICKSHRALGREDRERDLGRSTRPG